MHKDARHLVSHAGIYLLARGLPGIIAFLAIPLFSRLLDRADYGRYALVVATVSLLNALIYQWLRLSLVRFLPAYRENAGQLKSTLATISLLMLLLTGALAAGVIVLPFPQKWRTVALPCWLVLSVQSLFEISCEMARASLRPWYYMGLQVLRSSLSIAVGVTLILLGMGWWGPLGGLASGMGLAVLWAWWNDWSDIRLRIDGQTLKKICQYGIPLSVTVALTVVISSSDRFLIAAFMGEDAVGLYSVAVDFTSQTLTLVMIVINMAVFPMAVRAWEHHGKEAAQAQMRSNASLLMAVGIPCVIGISVLAPGIAHCFLGRSFREAAVQIIPLISLATFLGGMKAYHFDAAFQFAHRTIFQVWIVLAAAIIDIALNLVVIPRWGINGAAMASVVAYIVSIGLTAWLGRRYFELPFPVADAMRVLGAGAAMGAALFPWRESVGAVNLVLQVSVGAAIYGAVLVATDFLGLRRLVSCQSQRRELAPQGVAAAASMVES